jgi:hypothetical protein
MQILPGMLGAIERIAGLEPLAPRHRQALETIQERLRHADRKKQKSAAKLLERMEALVDDSTVSRLYPDGGWADYLRDWMNTFETRSRQPWDRFLQDAAAVQPQPPAKTWKVEMDIENVDPDKPWESEAYRRRNRTLLERSPSKAWKRKIAVHLDNLARERVSDFFQRCLHKVAGSKPGMLARRSTNRELMRGLLWVCRELGDDKLPLAVQSATKFFYKNNSPLAETGVVVLHQMASRAGATALANLARFVTKASQKSFVEFALSLLTEKLGLAPEELADDSIPTFGLTEVGSLTRDFGKFRAQLTFKLGRTGQVGWFGADGTRLKSVPAQVRRLHPEEVESLKVTTKAVGEALSALALSLESGYLTERKYAPDNWRKLFMDHVVGAVLGRQLIWQTQDGSQRHVFCWRDGAWVDSRGKSIPPSFHSPIALWHPLNATLEEVIHWRDRLDVDGMNQPFKQVYREIYKLTDAERATRIYSNRFAAHIIRQAQFRQLAKNRGWKIGLLGPWDGGDQQAAERKLLHWGLRAEFWVTGVGDQLHRCDLLATEQVRFYRHEAGGISDQPLGLGTIPPLVFSEIMRHVDMFVSVASVGNNPDWVDGGPGGQYRDYWQEYSFGELSATAQTRRALLERLLPRLKIAGRCQLEGRFLIVRGDLRSYKIHLGSGHILMTPNDQYLCIVPKQSAKAGDRFFLPFEGDGTLSVILSKAFLLADDTKITDATIVSQIQR